MNEQNGQQETNIVIGLGQLRVARRANTVLACLGLGSCVAICAYDPVTKVGGMAHLVLPQSSEGHSMEPSPKFVDCGIAMLLEEMEQLGAKRSRLIVKIVGGAHMIRTPGRDGLFNIGERNVKAARTVLADLGLPLRAADTGGRHGRTVRFYLDSGKLVVSAVGGVSHEL